MNIPCVLYDPVADTAVIALTGHLPAVRLLDTNCDGVDMLTLIDEYDQVVGFVIDALPQETLAAASDCDLTALW